MRALLVALILIPGVSAWQAPGTATADHPVFAGFTGDEHLEAEVAVWLDGFKLVEADVHEHDGVFTMAITPPGPGTLRFVRTIDNVTTEHTTTVVPTTYGTGFGAARLVSADGIVVEDAGRHLALFEATDEDLLARAWSEGAFIQRGLEAEVAALVVTHPEAAEAQGVASLGPVDVGAPPGDAALPPDLPACDGVGLDPPGDPAWQTGSHVRVTSDGPTEYALLQGAGLLLGEPQTSVRADDPFGQFTFRPQPGPGRLVVGSCQIDFLGLPGTTGGELELIVDQNPVGASISFAAASGDTLLPHYEFDAWIVRLEDDRPGRLVWAGKLHGHEGHARLHLTFLEPGDYEITTFASPQAIGTAAIGERHRVSFTIAPYGGAGDVENGTVPPWASHEVASSSAATPVPWGIVLVALAVQRVARAAFHRDR